MADYDEDEDFFEEDEPAEKIHAIFDRGEKGITWPPSTLLTVVVGSLNVGAVQPVQGFLGGQFVTGPQAVANTTGEVLAAAGG